MAQPLKTRCDGVEARALGNLCLPQRQFQKRYNVSDKLGVLFPASQRI